MSKHSESPETKELYLVMRTDRKVKRWLKTELRTDERGRWGKWIRYPAWAEGISHLSAAHAYAAEYAKGIPTKIVKFVPEIPL